LKDTTSLGQSVWIILFGGKLIKTSFSCVLADLRGMYLLFRAWQPGERAFGLMKPTFTLKRHSLLGLSIESVQLLKSWVMGGCISLGGL
jgi:hypothetical protein